jgi:hypothetical protein
MPIQVRFRGPMLFISENDAGDPANDVVDEVIIPDSVASGKHPDGTYARSHFAGLLIVRSDGSRTIRLLRGGTLTISDGVGATAPGVDADFLRLVPLNEMVNPQGTAASNRVTRKPPGAMDTKITIQGGRMSGMEVGDVTMEVPRHLSSPMTPAKLPLIAVWQSDATAGSVSGTDTNGQGFTEQIDPQLDVFIFNFDTADPTALDLEQMGGGSEHLAQDNDFKWLYELLAPPPGQTWSGWIGPDRFLPAPRVLGFSVKALVAAKLTHFPGTDTCDHARYRGA